MNKLRYAPLAISLHWLIGGLIFLAFAVGLYMSDLPFSPQKLRLYSWHKWAGVTIFGLVVARGVYRWFHAPPPLPEAMPRWQRKAAEVSHYLLYFFMFAVPLSGWLMSSAKGFQTVYFGWIPIPDLIGKNPDLGDVLQVVHKVLNFSMMAVVAAHVAAALKHHIVDKDDVLRRILPTKR
ncbi:MAG: cytochrome b [Betaproteobacteria bacterium]|nr:cytochrome b [Betaproteobacteria bacterium]